MAGLLLGGFLLVYGFVMATVPGTSPLSAVANLVVAGALLFLARRRGFAWEDLGLGRSGLATGLRWGAVAALSTAVLVVSGALLAPEPLRCGAGRVAGVDLPVLLFEVLLRAPIATAAAEEVMFRGVLVASLERRLGDGAAGLLSSLFFGLWHVAPTVALLQEIEGVPGCPQAAEAVVPATVLFTLAAGLFLWFLRKGSGSLAAPILVHAAYNSTGLLVTYAAVSSG